MAGFSRSERIRRRADFQHVYEHGARIHCAMFTLFLLAGQPRETPSRLGIAATKKLGGAVVRNRAKRLIREVFRRAKIAPGFDVVVVPKREMLNASLTALETEYRAIIERAIHRGSRQRAAGAGASGRSGAGGAGPAEGL